MKKLKMPLRFGLALLLVSLLLRGPIAPARTQTLRKTLPSAPSTAAQWDYTALGDSLAFGAFALPGKGYVPLYRTHLSDDTGASVRLFNLGIPGWMSRDLLNALRKNLLFRLLIIRSEVVSWNIGGNDLRAARNGYKDGNCGGPDNQDCLRQAVANFKANWDAILTEILSLRSTHNTILRTMDIYNPYVNEDRADDSWAADGGLNDFQVLKPYLEEANRHIAMTATSRGIRYAPVYLAFNGPEGELDPSDSGLISFDGLHPNTNGHRLIATLLRELGTAPLHSSGLP